MNGAAGIKLRKAVHRDRMILRDAILCIRDQDCTRFWEALERTLARQDAACGLAAAVRKHLHNHPCDDAGMKNALASLERHS